MEDQTITINDYLDAQQRWSERVFGPGLRTGGITEHIKLEIEEILRDPSDYKEWIDIIILAMDGYWRAGGPDLETDLDRKQNKNFRRKWPKPESEDKPSLHVKGIHD